jgi:hypothetical protein
MFNQYQELPKNQRDRWLLFVSIMFLCCIFILVFLYFALRVSAQDHVSANLHSVLEADYSADPRGLRLPAVKFSLIDDILKGTGTYMPSYNLFPTHTKQPDDTPTSTITQITSTPSYTPGKDLPVTPTGTTTPTFTKTPYIPFLTTKTPYPTTTLYPPNKPTYTPTPTYKIITPTRTPINTKTSIPSPTSIPPTETPDPYPPPLPTIFPYP